MYDYLRDNLHDDAAGDPTRMVVTWVTQDATNSSVCEFGPVNLDTVAKGTQTMFQDGGDQHRKLYIHRVTLEQLAPGKMYGERALFACVADCRKVEL